MLRLVVFIILWGISVGGLAQNRVEGRVISGKGKWIEGVHVRFLSGEHGAFTDSTGYFRLNGNLPGILKFTHLNYQELEITVVRDTFLWVVLYDLSHHLKEVTISGKEEGGLAYTSKQQIERVPAILGEKDILKYMATMPGVATTDALDPGIYVRGGNSSENSYRVNDIEITDPSHLTGILSTFDPWILNRSVLYKSGFPARYNDYLSAYINMFPDGGDKETYQREVSVGLLSTALKINGPLLKKHTSFGLALRTSYLQYVAKLYNQANDNGGMPSYSFYDATATIDSRLSERLSLNVFGLFTADRMRLGDGAFTSNRLKWGTFSANARLRYALNESDLILKVGYRSGDTQADMKKSMSMDGKNSTNSLLGGLEYRQNFGNAIQWITGVAFEHAGFFNSGLKQWNVRDADFDLYKIYSSLNAGIGRYWKMEGGVNYQYYNGGTAVGAFSPRLKINWQSNGWNIWGDYARTIQYLSRFAMLNVKSPVDLWCTLGRDMEPAVCDQYSLGVDKTWSNGWYIYMALFWKNMSHVKDFASVSLADVTAFADRQLEGKGKAKGVEWDVIYNGERLYFRMNYTLSDSWRKFEGINDGRRFNPPYDMRHNVLTTASLKIGRRWVVNAMWCYSSGMRATFPVGVAIAQDINSLDGESAFLPIYRERYNFKLPDNHRLDMNVDYHCTYKRCQCVWSVGMYNVYNQQNASFVEFKPEAQDKYYTRFVPYSKVLLPFIPYVNLKINW